MKAIIREKYCETDFLQIEDIDIPMPTADEILVKVHCTTVNRTDCSIVDGKPFIFRFFIGLLRPKRKITGSDFAGQVMAIGENVTSFNVGDRVFGLDDEGLSSHAEYLTINENKAIANIPKNIDYDQAVACAEGAHYAYNFLNNIDIKKNDKVLINGATGAIGSAALQLLIMQGAHVTAVCNTKNLSLMGSLGAHQVINYEKEDFTQLNTKFNLVADTVGKSRFKLCKKIMTSDGIYISSELGPKAENIFLSLIPKSNNKQRVVFPIPKDCRRSILYMSQLLHKSKFTAVIDRIYPMDDVQEAFRYVKTGMKTGNVILKIVK